MDTIELVAPAGSFETLHAAFRHGADAAYIGIGTHNLRAFAPTFDISQACEAARIAHDAGKKIYAALNTMPNDNQLAAVEQTVAAIAQRNEPFDAIIVSDPGIVSMCREMLRDTHFHLSTQTGTFNSRSMKFWRDQAIQRIVLPRELNLEQIRNLNASGICETEIFVHGAMCMSVSGRCLLGAYLSGRHPNHGECPQPCRYRYELTVMSARGVRESGEMIEVEEDASGAYFLNSKDLNTLPLMPAIAASGVSALKIEGRNKSAHYVSSVVKVYRAALDSVLSNADAYSVKQVWTEELERIDHRPYTTGFYAGEYNLQQISASKAAAKTRIVGVVKSVLDGDRVIVDVKNPFGINEALNVLPAKPTADPFTLSCVSLADMNGNTIDRAPTNTVVICTATGRLRTGDMLRKESANSGANVAK